MDEQTVDILLRSLLTLTVLFIFTRLMGKKQISQLSFFDYVVGITIGSIAANLTTDLSISIFDGILSLVIYTAIPILIGYLSLKSIVIRTIFGGNPTVLVQNGELVKKNLQRTRMHVNDVLEECRVKGAFNIADVEFAVLETNGQVSVQLKSQKQPLTPEDLKLPTEYKGLSTNLIIDGKIMKENLSRVNLNEKWLLTELEKRNVSSISEVLLASLDTTGKLTLSLNDKK